MKLSLMNKVLVGMMGGAVLLGIPSCSDDHYDIDGSSASKLSLWENIEATPELDSLAMILQRVRVYKNDEDVKRTITYKDLLSGGQQFTVWAPLNGTYNAQSYIDQLNEIDALRAAGDETTANRKEYNLGVQFAQNHMARFAHESQTEAASINLFNGKLATYDAAKKLFNSVKVDASSSAKPASNGLLHTLSGVSPFSYNIYDYIEAHTELFDSVYTTIKNNEDDPVFDEGSSTAGGMNSDGKLVYVDSVFIINNDLIDDSKAKIEDEDSFYVACIPTDAAWNQALATVGSLYNYGTSYKYQRSTANNEFYFSQTLPDPSSGTTLDTDSLAEYYSRKAIMTSMYFSPSMMPAGYTRNQKDEIIAYVTSADSLKSTNGTCFYKKAGDSSIAMFQGVEPVDASNGVIYPMTSYDVDPNYSYVIPKDYDLTYQSYILAGTANNGSGVGERITLTEGTNYDDSVDISMLPEKAYRCFEKPASRQLKVFIPLMGLYSTNYRIKIQMLPNRADSQHRWYDSKNDTLEIAQNQKFDAIIYDDFGNELASNKLIEVDENNVKTYTLFDNFQCPKCYVDLPDDTESFPYLVLQIPQRSAYYKRGYTSRLSVVKLIIEPVRDTASSGE